MQVSLIDMLVIFGDNNFKYVNNCLKNCHQNFYYCKVVTKIIAAFSKIASFALDYARDYALKNNKPSKIIKTTNFENFIDFENFDD